MSMMRPMPFWPSLDPWKKLTPVQVSDHESADRERRRRVVFGRFVERRDIATRLGKQDQHAGDRESDDRRDEQGLQHLHGLFPIDARGAGVRIEELIGDARRR